MHALLANPAVLISSIIQIAKMMGLAVTLVLAIVSMICGEI